MQSWLFRARKTGRTESATSGKEGVLLISEWEVDRIAGEEEGQIAGEEESQIAGREGVGEVLAEVVKNPKHPRIGEFSSVESRRE